MSIEPDQLLEAAQQLNRLRPPLVSEEVCGRTMVNRMYYACYLAIGDAISRRDGAHRHVPHTALVMALANAADERVRNLALHLGRLRRIRVTSDYRPDLSVSKTTAALHLLDARYVLDNIGPLAWRLPKLPSR